MRLNHFYCGDAIEQLKSFPDESVDCCVSSPPYWNLRDYEVRGQLGLEETFEAYLDNLVNIYAEVRRVLKKEGTCFVNLGDMYSRRGTLDPKRWKYKESAYGNPIHVKNLPPKTLCMVPYRFAIMMTEAQWILRNIIVWHKTNALPSSVKDRFTIDWEPIFFFSKNTNYYFEQQFEPQEAKPFEPRRSRHKAWDNDPLLERGKGDGSIMKYNPEGRNKRCVWSIPTKPFPEAHFATFPEALIEPIIKAGCPVSGVVMDPFMGAGTVALVALKNGRNFVGIEIKQEYVEIAKRRIYNIGKVSEM